MSDAQYDTGVGPLTAKLLEQQREIERLRMERDEARREAATFYARQFYKEDAVDRMSRIYAEECGWDCFLKEDGK